MKEPERVVLTSVARPFRVEHGRCSCCGLTGRLLRAFVFRTAVAANFNELFRLSSEEDGVSVDKVAGDVNGQLRVKVGVLWVIKSLGGLPSSSFTKDDPCWTGRVRRGRLGLAYFADY